MYSAVTNSGNPVVLISQDDLANFVGMNRANVAKYLKQLREEKIIETARNRIIVKNTKKTTELHPSHRLIFAFSLKNLLF